MKKNTLFITLFSFWFAVAQPPSEGGIEFNGIDEYILMPDSDNINTRPVDNRTVETYFKVDDATSRQTIYKEGGQVNSIKFIVEDGFLYLGCYRNSGGPGNLIYFRKPITNNTWYHVALVLDSANTLSFYLDGVLQDTRPNFFQIPVHPGNFELARSAGNTRYPDCNSWTTGGDAEYCLGDISANDPTSNYFGGHIWGFRIWDIVRTAQEINDNKDILITDTSTAPGEDLIAFLDGNSMSFLDSNDNLDSEDVQSNVLSVPEMNLSELSYSVANGRIEVQSNLGIAPTSITLYSLSGKKVSETKNQSIISTLNFSTGIYILRIAYQGNVLNRKIIIQNTN